MIIVFRLFVCFGGSGVVLSHMEDRICEFLSNLSYPLYMTHYVLVYFYVAWVSNHSWYYIMSGFAICPAHILRSYRVGLCKLKVVR